VSYSDVDPSGSLIGGVDAAIALAVCHVSVGALTRKSKGGTMPKIRWSIAIAAFGIVFSSAVDAATHNSGQSAFPSTKPQAIRLAQAQRENGPSANHSENEGKASNENMGGHKTAKKQAIASWLALKRYFGNSGVPNIFSVYPPGPNGKVVPNLVEGQIGVIHAALNVAKLTGDSNDFNRTEPTLWRYRYTRFGTTGYAPPLDAFKLRPPHIPTRWWDDNGSLGLILLQAYTQLGNVGYLQAAQKLWPFLAAGQDQDRGQDENDSPDGRNVISVGATGFDDMNAEHLYVDTPPGDLQRAKFVSFVLANDEAVKAKLRAPDGLYWDYCAHDIEALEYKWCDGTLLNRRVCSGTWWACNPDRPDLPTPQRPANPHVCAWELASSQGLMIQSDLLLYRITSDPKYLQSATTTAKAALEHYTTDALWKLWPQGNAMYFVGLVQLDHYAHDPRIRASLEAYLDRAWTKGRDPNTGLFNRGGIGMLDAKHGFSCIDQAGFVILYSLVAWPPDATQDVYGP
jgi:hypothetical protein